MFVFMIILGVVCLVGVILYLAWLFEKHRTKKVEEVAAQMGLQFSEKPEPGFSRRLQSFGLFNTGRDRKAKNLISGDTDEVTIAIFDYQYTTGSGKNSHTHRLTVAALESPRLNLPSFSLRPESLFDRLGALLGFRDINFEHHADFSRNFVLKGPDETAIRECFSPALLDFFAARGRISVEALGNRLIYYRGSRRIKPEEFPALLEEAYQIFGTLVD